MNNQNSMQFFAGLAENHPHPQTVKLAHNTDYTDIDAKFILQYVNKTSTLLDVGTGTGLIINKIYDKMNKITCVEPYANFTQFIIKSPNITIVNKNIFDFTTNEKFDIITAFGFIQYFNEQESINIYKKLKNYLKENGILIIKNQFGIHEDVIINGYSEEQKTDYFARYGFIDKEINLLEILGYKDVEKLDIYPPKANRWSNTHFYALVAKNTPSNK